MKLDEYQELAYNTAQMADFETEVSHFGFGLCAEAGEVATIFQKYFRGDERYNRWNEWDLDDWPESDSGMFTQEAHEMVKKELGDVLWHVAVLGRLFGFNLADIADTNIRKLADREARGVIRGDGDMR